MGNVAFLVTVVVASPSRSTTSDTGIRPRVWVSSAAGEGVNASIAR